MYLSEGWLLCDLLCTLNLKISYVWIYIYKGVVILFCDLNLLLFLGIIVYTHLTLNTENFDLLLNLTVNLSFFVSFWNLLFKFDILVLKVLCTWRLIFLFLLVFTLSNFFFIILLLLQNYHLWVWITLSFHLLLRTLLSFWRKVELRFTFLICCRSFTFRVNLRELLRS